MVALTAPAFLAASASGPYFLYGSVTLFTTVLCVFVMRETRGLSLESIGIQSSSPEQSPFSRMLDILRRRAGPPSGHPIDSPALELSPIQTRSDAVPIQPPAAVVSGIATTTTDKRAGRQSFGSATDVDTERHSVHSHAAARISLA
jgi:hypothetical protein